jgi:NAD(P) transhydrogenase subunit beta
MSNYALLNICYLIGSLGFIIGLKMLAKAETARKGNIVAAIGMAIAIFGTIFLYEFNGENGETKHLGNLVWIFGGMIIGTILGTISAKKVQMTAMPQMVSIFNGMGGICAGLIGMIEFTHLANHSAGASLMTGHSLTILVGLIIGSISFAGSVIAFLKLNGNLGDYSFKGQSYFNMLFLAAVMVMAYYVMSINGAQATTMMYVLFIVACIYGVSFVMPIGGADMPVVISLLNSFTGVAAAFGGFLYHNQVMLTGGILVGAAGTLLTILMCNAMNRSLLNVIIGSFGGGNAATAITGENGGTIKEIGLSDSAINMSYAQKVIIVPGYGLAVAQAQHICHELEKQLTEKGVEVKYAIHPVAGRMPGHMNVLLAEADVSYDKLLEMDAANDEFATTDVVLILGANDVVNPAAKTNPASPIFGMPILEVEKAKTVIVNKRSMNKGYAGIDNDLFYSNKTRMLFGDAKKVLQELVNEVKAN